MNGGIIDSNYPPLDYLRQDNVFNMYAVDHTFTAINTTELLGTITLTADRGYFFHSAIIRAMAAFTDFSLRIDWKGGDTIWPRYGAEEIDVTPFVNLHPASGRFLPILNAKNGEGDLSFYGSCDALIRVKMNIGIFLSKNLDVLINTPDGEKNGEN